MKGWVRASKLFGDHTNELNRGKRAFWGFKGSNIGVFSKIRNKMQFREVSGAKINFQNKQLHGIQKLFNLARYIGNCQTKTCLAMFNNWLASSDFLGSTHPYLHAARTSLSMTKKLYLDPPNSFLKFCLSIVKNVYLS